MDYTKTPENFKDNRVYGAPNNIASTGIKLDRAKASAYYIEQGCKKLLREIKLLESLGLAMQDAKRGTEQTLATVNKCLREMEAQHQVALLEAKKQKGL